MTEESDRKIKANYNCWSVVKFNLHLPLLERSGGESLLKPTNRTKYREITWQWALGKDENK